MIIPLPFTWGRQPSIGQQDQIDRAVHNRNYRLIAGLNIGDAFDRVSAVLLVSTGHGKFIRCRHIVEAELPIPAALKKSCLEMANGRCNDCGQFASVVSDLAAVQASLIERLKIEAGKYVDRILAVSINDPGLWRTDFDGRRTYRSFCDATRLAELSGVTVIDNLPAADLAAGGNGKMLEALPLWLLAADRNERVAKREKFVLSTGCTSHLTSTLLRLPVSDGRDAELPQFEAWQLENSQFVPWRPEISTGNRLQASHSTNQHAPPSTRDLIQALDPFLRQFIQNRSNTEIVEVLLVCNDTQAAEIADCVNKFAPVSVLPVSRIGVSPNAVEATLVAILGLMHIDQFPANVPWLTGANSQRILGRLTVGRPSNWRQLVRTMADYHPAAMKLKDAV